LLEKISSLKSLKTLSTLRTETLEILRNSNIVRVRGLILNNMLLVPILNRSLEFERRVGIQYIVIVRSVWWRMVGYYLVVGSGPWTNSDYPRLYLQYANIHCYWKVFTSSFIVQIHIHFLGQN